MSLISMINMTEPKFKCLKHYSKTIYRNVNYHCDQCDHSKDCLKWHIESVHGNVTYACDQCDYKVTWKSYVKQHIESVHQNVTYPCKATQKIKRKKIH